MSRKRIAAFAALAVVPVILALWLAGFDVAYQLGNYVVTDNATIAGDTYQASAPASGQIADVLLDVGDSVDKGQGLASLISGAPAPTGAQPQVLLPLRTTTNVRSPAPGTIVRLNVVKGQSVQAGQPVATVADLSNLWVVANVDETSFKDVRPGMAAEIYVNALDRYFRGEVVGLLPDLPNNQASAAPARAGSGSAAKPVSQVPVRLRFDYADATVYPGMTATVKIFIRG